MNWYENIGKMLDIPVIMIDVPYNDKYDVDAKRVAYMRGQFDDCIKQLEGITGKKWDENRFAEVCEISNKVGQAWLEATQYMLSYSCPWKIKEQQAQFRTSRTALNVLFARVRT